MIRIPRDEWSTAAHAAMQGALDVFGFYLSTNLALDFTHTIGLALHGRPEIIIPRSDKNNELRELATWVLAEDTHHVDAGPPLPDDAPGFPGGTRTTRWYDEGAFYSIVGVHPDRETEAVYLHIAECPCRHCNPEEN